MGWGEAMDWGEAMGAGAGVGGGGRGLCSECSPAWPPPSHAPLPPWRRPRGRCHAAARHARAWPGAAGRTCHAMRARHDASTGGGDERRRGEQPIIPTRRASRSQSFAQHGGLVRRRAEERPRVRAACERRRAVAEGRNQCQGAQSMAVNGNQCQSMPRGGGRHVHVGERRHTRGRAQQPGE